MVNMSVMEASVFREAKPLNLNLCRQRIIPTAFSISASGDRTAGRAEMWRRVMPGVVSVLGLGATEIELCGKLGDGVRKAA
jgi:hypothetical protein